MSDTPLRPGLIGTDDTASLRRSEERFRALVAHAADVSMVLTADLRVEYASPASQRVFGYSPSELARLPAFLALVDRDDAFRVRAAFEHAAQHPAVRTTVAFRSRHRSGPVRHLEAAVTNLLLDPSVEGIVVNVHDVTDRKEFELALDHQAMHDPLTGLPGRSLLVDRITQALVHRHDESEMIVVLLLDLDRFKVVNDSLGHRVGDELLVQIARRLAQVLRPGDTVARLGGDEFVVLCRDVGASGVTDLPRRVLRAVSEPVDLTSGPYSPTTSIGVVVARKEHTAETILRDADAAMYVAKERGRNRFAFFDDSVRAHALDRLDIENALRQAVEQAELRLHYQPVFEVRTRALSGVEALVRWDHPERGLLDASQFVPAAEEAGLIGRIGTWALAEACAEAARWHARFGKAPGRTWVNLAAQQLADPDLLGTVRRALDETGLDPGQLGLEITETGIVREPEAALAVMTSLRDLGISFALDDFGTGYSSLAHLRRFPVDVVKIDQTFVSGLGVEPPAITAAVIAMGHALGITVIAEGVETREQLDVLRLLGCDAAQGFFLGAPVPANELGPVLAA